MYFISFIFMWVSVYFFQKYDDIPNAVLAPRNFVFWSIVHFAVYFVVCSRVSPAAAAVAAWYLTTAAMIDYHTGCVYTVFSYVSLFLYFFFLDFCGNPCQLSDYLIFLGYLKILELSKAFGGGDTEYLFFVYCLNRSVYGDRAEIFTVMGLLLSALLHRICHKGQKGLKPFTPQILMALVSEYIFFK